MVVTIHQPAYIPWLGYFEKIKNSDVYIYLDTVQFEKRGFSHRNKIKSSNGPIWLTVPVKTKGHRNCTIRDILIDNTQDWKKRHLKTIFTSYKKAEWFNLLYPKLERLYQDQHDYLSDLAYAHLLFWLSELRINTQVIRSSELLVHSKKSDLILELCVKMRASRYISGTLGRNYINESDFERHSIAIEYQDYKYPNYSQLFGEFIPNLSVVDFWMNSHELDLI